MTPDLPDPVEAPTVPPIARPLQSAARAWLLASLFTLVFAGLITGFVILRKQLQPDAAYRLGREALDRQDYDSALAYFNESVRGAPRDGNAFFMRGFTYSCKHEYGAAIQDFNEAIRLYPKDAEAYAHRGSCYYSLNDYDRAIADCGRAVRLDPRCAFGFQTRAAAYNAKRDYDKALEDSETALRLDPNSAYAHSERGFAHFNKKAYDLALADYNRAIGLDPGYATAYAERGLVNSALKEYSKAAGDFNQSIELDPKSSRGYAELAWLWATCPDPVFRDGKKALEYATKACELSSWKETNDLDALAAAHAELGQFEEAVKWQKKSLEILPIDKRDSDKATVRLKLYENRQPYRDEE